MLVQVGFELCLVGRCGRDEVKLSATCGAPAKDLTCFLALSVALPL